MKKLILISTLALSLSTLVYAEEGRRPENRNDRPLKEMRELKDNRAVKERGVIEDNQGRPLKELREEKKEDIKELKRDFKDDKREGKIEMHNQIKANKEETKVKIMDLRKSGDKEGIKLEIEKAKQENEALREKFKLEMQTKRAEFKTQIKKEISEFKDGKKIILNQQKQLNVTKHLDNAFNRLGNAIKNITDFNARLKVVIKDKEERGADVTDVSEKLIKAEEALQNAQNAVEDVKEAVESAIKDTTGVAKEAVKAAIIKAVESIKTAREASRLVINSMPKVEDNTNDDDESDSSTN